MRRYRRFVSVLSAVIVFVTTYALILPAITLDKETAVEQPGIEVAAGDNNASESGTVYENETEPEEAASVESDDAESDDAEADDAEAESPITENAGSEASVEAAVEETEASSEEAESVTEETVAAATESAAKAITEAAAAATTKEAAAAEEIKLITEDTQLVFEGSDYIVYADFGESAKFPVGVVLMVKEITEESDPAAYKEYYDKAQSEMQGKYDENTKVSFARFYDITFKYNFPNQ